MSPSAAGHVCLVGATRSARTRHLADLSLPPAPLPPVSAHRRRRGPYTAAGTILRAVVPDALTRVPELVAAHEVEILTAAPELRDVVPATRETLTSLASPKERTRYYSGLRTLRIAHGLTEFLRDLLRTPSALVIDDLDQADPTDQEFVAVLLRRLDPTHLTVVAAGTAAMLDLPADPARPDFVVPDRLHEALHAHCRLITAPAVEPAPLTDHDPAAHYVATDCTDDDPRLLAAYAALAPTDRQRLHDERADELAARGERSLGWGAIAYHREHGADPLGRGTAALLTAADETLELGLYSAAVDLCRRGRAIVSGDDQPDLWWRFTGRLPGALAALGRGDEGETICRAARDASTKANVHMQCAYTTAMYHTRHSAPDRRDHLEARMWINQAIAFADQLTDHKEKAFRGVFYCNGLALIEAHLGRPMAALRLVTDGIARLDEQLGPDEHQLHRSVLRHNRAQVLVGLGRPDEALADYRTVIATDPRYPEYHFELGNLLRAMGRDDEARAEYETAMRLGPPFAELYCNRGNLHLDNGRTDAALADFDYVLELDPTFVPAYLNRAGIHAERGELDPAERDAVAGLRFAPDNPYLHAILGQVHTERGDHAAAAADFDRALDLDPDLLEALAGRAGAAQLAGDVDRALADLDRVVALDPDNPMWRYNRAFVLRADGRWDAALADLDTAVTLAPDDEEVRAARMECLANLST